MKLEGLPHLEEFICINVAKLKRVAFSSQARLRSLELSRMSEFEAVEPLDAVAAELRVVELNRVPRVPLHWLREARKIECITLRLGEIPTISFLAGLKRLQVLDLFGTKVKDGDISLGQSLKGELPPKLWALHDKN